MSTRRALRLLDIPQIDDEHREIIKAILKFRAHIVAGKGWLEQYSVMDELEQKVQLHFRVEEHLMQIYRYPNMEKHVFEHGEYSCLLREVKERLLRQPPTTVTADFLLNWWFQHISDFDQGYADWFSKMLSRLEIHSRNAQNENAMGSGI